MIFVMIFFQLNWALVLSCEKMYTNLVRDLIHGYTSDVEKGRVLFRSVG